MICGTDITLIMTVFMKQYLFCLIKAVWNVLIWFVLLSWWVPDHNDSHAVWAANKERWLHQTEQYSTQPAFCYGGLDVAHQVHKPLCFCLTHTAGKLDFPSLEMGLPNRIISSPIYYRLILELSVLARCSSQTNRQKRADVALNHPLSCWFISWKWGSSSVFSSLFSSLIRTEDNSPVTSL